MWQMVIGKDPAAIAISCLYCPTNTKAYELGLKVVRPRHASSRVLYWDHWPAFEFLFKVMVVAYIPFIACYDQACTGYTAK